MPSPARAVLEPIVKCEVADPSSDASPSTPPTITSEGVKKRKSPAKTSPSVSSSVISNTLSTENGDVKPDIDLSDLESATPTKKPRQKKPKTTKQDGNETPKTPTKKFSVKAEASSPGDFTPEKKERLKAIVFMAGIGAIDQKELAAQLELSVKQISNALCSGRKGNIRDQMVAAAGH